MKSIFFKDLKPGEVFVTLSGNVYMKISGVDILVEFSHMKFTNYHW